MEIALKKLPFNKYVGLRLPWTLDDCQTWRYAHMLLYELTFPTILLGITILFCSAQ
ncbi:MAG: SdpI family protein [Faecalibacterium prausnitzii]